MARATALVLLIFPVSLWGLGITLETMRRLERVSSLGALLAGLAAFSLLLAGGFVLCREWFVLPRRATKNQSRWIRIAFLSHAQLHGSRVAWSLLLLTLAGWFFGGFALPFNSLFALQNADYERVAWPQGWLLLLCGAQLLGAAKSVQSPHEAAIRVLNPKGATWFLLLLALGISHPKLFGEPLVGTVALAGFVPFLLKTWGARRRFRRGPRLFWLFLGAVCVLLPAFLWKREALSIPVSEVVELWKTPSAVWSISLFFWSILALTKARCDLRAAFSGRFSARPLLLATASGAVFAALLFGPNGVLFWAFFPLLGLFFDLLARRREVNFSFATCSK